VRLAPEEDGMKAKNVISHRERKNPQSRDAYREKRREQNAARPKQTYNLATKEWVRAALMFLLLLLVPGLAQSQTRAFIDTQFGSESGMGYKFPHLAVGAGFDHEFHRHSVSPDSQGTIRKWTSYTSWFDIEIHGDYSPDHKYGFNRGSVVTGGGFGNIWLTPSFGLTGGSGVSRLQTPAYHKAGLFPQAGVAFRFIGGGFPMRLYVNWIFPTGSYNPATGIEPNRLRGPELFWETQMTPHIAVGLRFGIFKGYSQGNPVCDGTLGNGSQVAILPCPRGTFTQGITVLHFRFTSKVRMP
jgi:hypothetical protein